MKLGPTQQAIIDALRREGPMKASDIPDVVDLTESGIRRAIDRMRDAHGSEAIYVHSYHLWRGTSAKDTKVWAAGPGVDAKRPTFGKKARIERQRRYRANNKVEINRREAARKRVSRGYSIKAPSVFGSMVAAMTG